MRRHDEVMNERWIVGIDGSFGSRSALGWALHHAPDRQARIVAVKGYARSAGERAKALLPVGGEPRSGAGTVALAELDASITDLDPDGHVERVVAEGAPARAIINAAHDASLIVVGRHGSGGIWHGTIGSVSRYCVTHAPVPTVVVPTDWNRTDIRRILVGFDGSDHATAALGWALDFARGDTTVVALVAIEIAPWLAPELVELRLEHELRAEEQRLIGLLDAADPHGLVEREVVVRGARPALARAAEHADLVVVGAHGAGRVMTNVIGSVSTWLLDVCTNPVVVVPERSEP